jgi:hypothetical protein
MNTYEKTRDLWEQHRQEFEQRIQGWADNLKGMKEEVKKSRSQFRAWKPLDVYVSHSLVREGRFSIRFFGQEVAKLKILGGKKTLIVEKRHFDHNAKYFQLKSLQPGEYGWEKEARGFRKDFKNLPHSGNRTKTGIEELKLEWLFLREMSKRSIENKFSGKLAYIQPVMMASCPFQMPLPLGGSGGGPKKGDGHVDILARRRRKENGKVVLSLWELKDVGKLAEAVKQAYIYAVTMLLMLRSPSGKQWWDIFGFNGRLPERLEVEGVVAVSKDQKNKLLKAVKETKDDMPLSVEEGEVKLYACFYDPPLKAGMPDSLSIDSFEELPA